MTRDDVLEAFDAFFPVLDADGEAAARLFADDDDVTMWGSVVWEQASGPAAVAALLREIADGPDRLHLAWERRDVHVEGDAAWVNALLEVSVERDGQVFKTVPYRITAIFVRRDGAWRWHTFNGSEPD